MNTHQISFDKDPSNFYTPDMFEETKIKKPSSTLKLYF